MKNKKKYLLVSLLLGIAAACIIIIAIQFRLRGSIKVVPSEDIAGVEAVFYRQDDVRWSADFLGDSQYIMGAEVICDQEGNPLIVTECPVSRRGPVQCSIYTKYVNTLFSDGY